MNWENCEPMTDMDTLQSCPSTQDKCYTENEQKKRFQLQKLKDPTKDTNRQAYISIASKLGDWVGNDNKEQDIKSVLTDNFEAFLFNFAELTPVWHGSNPAEFLDVYKDVQVIKREIKEVNVDLESTTAFQVCYYEILNKKENKIISQFSFEIFSFRRDKISKYRACFGWSTSFNEYHHPFTPSRKDLMLAKVKELNYAWADQPDLDKIASLLDDPTEYKVWRWHDQKAFTFYKSDFATHFRNLEEKYAIKCVVPYEVYSEGQFILGTYAFHLDGKDELRGKKFMWLSTCIYKFDKDVKIEKINQQGELYQEDEIIIPFKVHSKEVLKQQIETNELKIEQADLRLLDTSEVNFSFEASLFHSLKTEKVDYVKGFSEFDKLSKIYDRKSRGIEWEQIVDFFADLHDPSYEVTIYVECAKAGGNQENERFPGMEWDRYIVKKLCLENGKLAKVIGFSLEVPEPIPSPFDDQSFRVKNNRHREDTNAE